MRCFWKEPINGCKFDTAPANKKVSSNIIWFKPHVNEKVLHCLMCCRFFKTTSNLEIHLKVHTKVRPFKCPICITLYQFDYLQLIAHQKSHSSYIKGKQFECLDCNKIFRGVSELTKHLSAPDANIGEVGEADSNIDLEKAPFDCPVCRLSFPCRSSLSIHWKKPAREHLWQVFSVQGGI